jgi:excinuclease ABC subunit B
MSQPTTFQLEAPYQPAGDQPQAIAGLVAGLRAGAKHQTLLGVTGSGKTFTIANVIAQVQRPTLVIAHNKTLAAQLTQEFRTFFPNNAVEYFVSYYDYYQPEAYLPSSDTYIEKEADINEEIDRLRHAATAALLSRRDVIVVASVSAIYGLGSPSEYKDTILPLEVAQKISREELLNLLLDMYYVRSQTFERGSVAVRGSILDILPTGMEQTIRVELDGDQIRSLSLLNTVSREVEEKLDRILVFPAKHFVVSAEKLQAALVNIDLELNERVKILTKLGKMIEADRLNRRTHHDMAMLREIGYCNGIENYSRHLSGRPAGESPNTLLDYFPSDFLTVIDESHVTISQIRGMFAGDQARKNVLIDYGFRLPSALDNRPLRFEEFDIRTPQRVYLSATPGPYEREHSTQIVEQVIRPTGLIDPEVIIRPITGQVEDGIKEIQLEVAKKQRILVTTLTKKMAEDLSEFLTKEGVKSRYLHSDVETLERIRTLDQLRKGEIEVLVGVNLLREGIDLPEVSLVLIFDADREGFLRSDTSLIQTMGRAARNVQGRVILYADIQTGSIKRAIKETDRRRKIQMAYNLKHNITPQTIQKTIKSILPDDVAPIAKELEATLDPDKLPSLIKRRELEMKQAAKELRFEEATLIRDEVIQLRKLQRQFRDRTV